MANVAKLENTMTDILDHPETWNQGVWHCGTQACYAGHAVQAEGYDIYYGNDFVWAVTKGTKVNPRHEDEYIKVWQVIGLKAHRVPILNRAADVLGINEDEAHMLFYGGNDLDTLQAMVKDLCNGDSLTDKWQEKGGGFVPVEDQP